MVNFRPDEIPYLFFNRRTPNHSATTMQQILRKRRAKEGKAEENSRKGARERPEGNSLD
jgi:hypothetical protein